jgi:chemotaxis protein CheD
VKIIVDISDADVSNDPNDTLVTYSLGSCIGVALYDPTVKAGGMLHYQLPTATMDAAKANKNPLMFADSGMNFLLQKISALGANTKRLQVKIAGGAQMMNDASMFNIGKRNYTAIRQILWKKGMFINSEDVGGGSARNLSLDINSGTVVVKSQGQTKEL